MVATALLALWGRGLDAQGFEFGFECPQRVEEGDEVTVALTLTSRGFDFDEEDGPYGWSLGVANRGIDIVDVSWYGTVAADVEDGGLVVDGFRLAEVIDPDHWAAPNQGQGCVSAVALSFTFPITLSPNSRRVVLRATYRPEMGLGGSAARLEYRDGLRGSGQPMSNAVVLDGQSHPPVLGSCEFAIDPRPEFAIVADSPRQMPLDREFEVVVSICPVDPDAPPEDGVQGWSLGMTHDARVVPVGLPTYRGTDADAQPGGFIFAEHVDPFLNGGQGGLVTGVALSFGQTIVLDPARCQSVVRATYEAAAGVRAGASTRFGFVDGLRGSGQPVNTDLTVRGETVDADRIGSRTTFIEPRLDFVRGDANDDGRVNLADSIWTIRWLLRLGAASPCFAAADANGDAWVDLTDAVFTVAYRFLQGAAPSAPFPDCGPVESIEGSLPCESSVCAP